MQNLERYQRQLQLKGFGYEAQEKLSNAKVLVVGAGGLGIPALQYLASMGVGTIGIVDGDIISISNLNRQVLYTEVESGTPKVEVAKQKLSIQNPAITIHSYYTFLTRDNALEIISSYNLVIDATDNFSARYLINDACVILNKPFVYGAVQGFEGQLSVFNYKDGPSYRCLYPAIPTVNETQDCNTAGVLGVVPAMIGCQQAMEAVKIITQIGESISGHLVIFDFLNNTQYKTKLKTLPANKTVKELQPISQFGECYKSKTIEPSVLNQWFNKKEEFSLVDVRELSEFEQEHIYRSISVPLGDLHSNCLLPFSRKIVTVCSKGNRSLQAAAILKSIKPQSEVFSLEGGIEKWKLEIGDKLIAL
jgi:molybdopterin/thiamine biosynthesis adenylyltransferase/rhodanese-related sulfurtransferase